MCVVLILVKCRREVASSTVYMSSELIEDAVTRLGLSMRILNFMQHT